EMAKSIKGKMIISVNDIPEMRKTFAGLEMQSVGIKYNLQVTEKAKPKRELIIRNF
ncbi:DNA adenine methylase, partial [Salmonella enterica subsp. enterica serovar Poano]|nr:DNA adenine methylase [Salmonella enterica subsp. enterica serovar Poano]ECS5201088.1 DNA adenine methylase [Salmonella enterica subsp. enterica serovar Poano]